MCEGGGKERRGGKRREEGRREVEREERGGEGRKWIVRKGMQDSMDSIEKEVERNGKIPEREGEGSMCCLGCLSCIHTVHFRMLSS